MNTVTLTSADVQPTLPVFGRIEAVAHARLTYVAEASVKTTHVTEGQCVEAETPLTSLGSEKARYLAEQLEAELVAAQAFESPAKVTPRGAVSVEAFEQNTLALKEQVLTLNHTVTSVTSLSTYIRRFSS